MLMNNIVKKGIERATDMYTVSVTLDKDDRDVLDVITLPNGVSMDVVECNTGLYVTFSGKAELVMDAEQMLYDLAALVPAPVVPCGDVAEAHV